MSYKKLKDRNPIEIATVLLPWVLGFIAYNYYRKGGMLAGHIKWVDTINNGTDFIDHPGLFWLSGLFHRFTSLSSRQSIFIITSLHVGMLLPAIMWALKQLDFTHAGAPRTYLLGALAVMIAAPVAIPFLPLEIYNFSTANRVPFLLRNATLMCLLPYMYAAFGLLMVIIRGQINQEALNRETSLMAGFFVFMSALIKPSFAISILPTIGLYVLFQKKISWGAKLKIGCIFIPTALLLLCSLYIGIIFNPWRTAMPFIFAPLKTWRKNNMYPYLNLFLSIAFPACILLYRVTKIDFFTKIAWLNLLIATLPYAFFTMGERDLEWPYLNACQLLMLCSVVEWWKWIQEKYPKRIQSSGITGPPNEARKILRLHIICGCIRAVCVDNILFKIILG